MLGLAFIQEVVLPHGRHGIEVSGAVDVALLSLAWVASGVLIIVRSAAMRSVAASAALAGMSAPVQGLGGPALVTATVLFIALSVSATTKRPSNNTMHPPILCNLTMLCFSLVLTLIRSCWWSTCS